MNITHVIHSLNIGGAQKLLLSIIPAIKNRKNRFSVYYYQNASQDLSHELLLNNVELHKYPAPLSYFRPYRCYVKVKHVYEKYRYINLAFQLNKNCPSILHVHLQKLSEINRILKICNTKKIPLVWTIHGKISHTPEDIKIFDKEILLAIENCIPLAIVYVGVLPEFIIKKKYPPIINVVHISSCINVMDYQIAEEYKQKRREQLGIDFNEFIIGFVGRFSNEKGVDISLHAFAVVFEHEKRLKLILVGDGPEREKLELLSKQLNIQENVIFTGLTDHVKDYLAVFDIYVQPSRNEGLPLSILEAMSAGVPVIATDVGGVPYAIENFVTGLLIPPEDPKAIADSIILLKANRGLCQKLIVNSKEKVRAYDVTKITKDYENLYEELIIRKCE